MADTALLIGFFVGLFLVLPVALGLFIPSRPVAFGLWLVLGALATFSQSQDDSDAQGLWVLIVLFVLFDLALVELGHRLREERSRTRAE